MRGNVATHTGREHDYRNPNVENTGYHAALLDSDLSRVSRAVARPAKLGRGISETPTRCIASQMDDFVSN